LPAGLAAPPFGFFNAEIVKFNNEGFATLLLIFGLAKLLENSLTTLFSRVRLKAAVFWEKREAKLAP